MNTTSTNPSTKPTDKELQERASVEHDEFAKLVERCRTQKLPDIIENTSMQHATILLRGLIQHAAVEKTDIKMVSGKLFAGVFQPLVLDLSRALDQGCKVDAIILCQQSELDENQFYSTLTKHRNGSALVVGRQESFAHFFVSGCAYRLEVDDGAMKAYASFNDKDGIVPKFLETKFKKIKELMSVRRGDGWTSPVKQMA